MREIEFRGKRIDNDKWIYGYLRETGHQNIEKSNGQYIRTEKYYQIQDNKYNSQFVKEETIGQYTGLKDKNGKKIYEGDIVKDDYCIYKVKYDVDSFEIEVVKLLRECGTQVGTIYPVSKFRDIEVIGNIWENGELLE